MAGDWIPMRSDLARDPAVIATAERLGLDPDLVVGKLHKLWAWADEQTIDGVSRSGVTFVWLDRYIGVTDFASALHQVGWLQPTADGFCIPNFEKYMGESAKTRALARRRQARKRSRDRVTTVTQVSRKSNVYRTEEKSKKPHTPLADFSAFWTAYPLKVGKKDATHAWAKLAPSAELLTVILAALDQHKRSAQWTKQAGEFIPNPASWLNGEKWNDELKPALQSVSPSPDPYAHFPRWCDRCAAEHAAKEVCPKETADHAHVA